MTPPEPKQFQREGAQFLATNTRALLADEPGVGKTAQVVLATQLLNAGSVRVICPAVGMKHWRREFQRWWIGGHQNLPRLNILSYEEARLLVQAGVTIARTDILVLDESHYAKNPDAGRSLATLGRNGFGWYSNRIWCLSGTPAPNNVSELWPMLRAFGATKLGFEEFKLRYCVVDQNGKVRGSRPEMMYELRAILKPFTLRRKKSEVLPELGAIDIQPWYVQTSARLLSSAQFAEQARREEAALRETLKDMEPEEMLAFLAGTQEFSTVRRYNAILKVPAVLDQILFEIEAGQLDKVVVYGYHKEPLDVLAAECNKAGVGAVVIHGSVPNDQRDELIQWWKQPDGPRVMCASIIAAGVVLDFTEAHQGIMLEMDWVPGNNLQAMQRMHRHGQTNPVTVRVANGSPIDELINDVVSRKAQQLAKVFD